MRKYTLVLLFALIAVAFGQQDVARVLKSTKAPKVAGAVKSTKAPTVKATKAPTVKSAKAPSVKATKELTTIKSTKALTTIKSHQKKFGRGKMQHYIKLKNNVPFEFGLELSREMVDNLTEDFPPTGAQSDGKYDIYSEETGELMWPCCGYEIEFGVNGLPGVPFKYVGVNYNPAGHIPVGVYNTPHFDFHWYAISSEQVKEIEAPDYFEEFCDEGQPFPIPLSCSDKDRLLQHVPADEKPPKHCTPAPGATVEPAMGNHLIDLVTPSVEFDGNPERYAPFTHTWIFGTQDGMVSFLEPMISVEFLLSLKDDVAKEDTNDGVFVTNHKMEKVIDMPAAASVPGYYPQKYTIEFDEEADVYRVALTDAILLEKGTEPPVSVVCPPPP